MELGSGTGRILKNLLKFNQKNWSLAIKSHECCNLDYPA